jgi:LPS sulfotransferase NodH
MRGGMSGFVSPRYDLNHGGPPSKVYVVASSYRSGSTHLCHCLWETGVLGAPWEYLNYENDMRVMLLRLGASGVTDYFIKLLACRTSRNGVFGVKAHFHHFEAAFKAFPGMLKALPPVQFIYINRRDKVAQAVSMAKSIQTNAWLSLSRPRRTPLFYSADFIAACLEEVEAQTQGWMQWFAANGIKPFNVDYEDLLSDEQGIIDSIIALMNVASDEPDLVVLPKVERQSDAINAEWIRRYRVDNGLDRAVALAPIPVAARIEAAAMGDGR